jgi:hypothetical protein
MSGQTGVFAREPSSAGPTDSAESSAQGTRATGDHLPPNPSRLHSVITMADKLRSAVALGRGGRFTTAGAGFVSKGLDEDVVTGWALSTNAIFRLPATKPQIQVMILILKPHTQKVVLATDMHSMATLSMWEPALYQRAILSSSYTIDGNSTR